MLECRGLLARTQVYSIGKKYSDHVYSITQQGSDYVEQSQYYKELQIKSGYLKNKVKFPILVMMKELKGKSIETKLWSLAYFFASNTYKQNATKLTNKFFFKESIPIEKELKSKEYRNMYNRFKVIMKTVPLKSQTQYLQKEKPQNTKVSGTYINESKDSLNNRLNKSKFFLKNVIKAKQMFIDKAITCCFFIEKQKSKFLSFSPFVKNTKTLLRNTFGGMSLRKLFREQLVLLEKKPTNEQVINSLLLFDQRLNMGAVVENERLNRILQRKSAKLSESERMSHISRAYTDMGLSHYMVEDLKKKQVLQNKTHTILEITIDLQDPVYRLQPQEYQDFSEEEIGAMRIPF